MTANIVAQFKIEGEFVSADKNNNDIKAAVTQRLRNRSAIFDKLIEEDVRDDHGQLNDFIASTVDDSEESDADFGADVNLTTVVDIELTVNEDQLEILELDPDLVFMKAISELESGVHQFEATNHGEFVVHLAFRK